MSDTKWHPNNGCRASDCELAQCEHYEVRTNIASEHRCAVGVPSFPSVGRYCRNFKQIAIRRRK